MLSFTKMEFPKSTRLEEPEEGTYMTLINGDTEEEFTAIYGGRNVINQYKFDRVDPHHSHLAIRFSLGDIDIQEVDEMGRVHFRGNFIGLSPTTRFYVPCGNLRQELKILGLR